MARIRALALLIAGAATSWQAQGAEQCKSEAECQDTDALSALQSHHKAYGKGAPGPILKNLTDADCTLMDHEDQGVSCSDVDCEAGLVWDSVVPTWSCTVRCKNDATSKNNCHGYGQDEERYVCVTPPSGMCVTGWCVRSGSKCGSQRCEAYTKVNSSMEACFSPCPDRLSQIDSFAVRYEPCDWVPTPAPTPVATTPAPTPAPLPVCTIKPERLVVMGKMCEDSETPYCSQTVARCIDATDDGKVELVECAAGEDAKSQLWELIHASSQIKWHKDPTKCLAVEGGEGMPVVDGAAVKLMDCAEACAVVDDPTVQGFCVDTPLLDNVTRTRHVKSSCRGVPSDTPGVFDTNLVTGNTKCLEAVNPNADGAGVSVQPCSDLEEQVWRYFDYQRECPANGDQSCDCTWALAPDEEGINACQKDDATNPCFDCCCKAPVLPTDCIWGQPECP